MTTKLTLPPLPITAKKNVSIRVSSPPAAGPLLKKVVSSSPLPSPPPPIRQQQQSVAGPVIIPRADRDDTLSSIMNPQKVRNVDSSEPPDALTSPQARKFEQRLGRPAAFEQEEDYGDEYDEGAPLPPGYEYADEYEGDSQFSLPGQPGPTGHPWGPPQQPQPPTEEELLQKAVRKAKLLARIQQLEKRGIKPDKVYGSDTSLEELRVAVAKMEIIAGRTARIEQGRTALMMFTGGMERACNYVDENKYLGEFELCMRGYSKDVYGNLHQYDDVLERGMEELLGPPENRRWYIELAMMLTASAVMYSMANRARREDEMKRTVEMLKNNKDFMDSIRAEIRNEMTGMRQPSPVVSPIVAPPPIQSRITMRPPAASPPKRQPNLHPEGDISPVTTQKTDNKDSLLIEFDDKN